MFIRRVLPTSAELPAVITLTSRADDMTEDDMDLAEACRRLEEAGAAVVGLNCGRGPETLLPTLRKVRQACKVSNLHLL